jgi:hypothetical protein
VAPRSRRRGVLHTSESRIQPPAKASLYVSICVGQSLIMLQKLLGTRSPIAFKSSFVRKVCQPRTPKSRHTTCLLYSFRMTYLSPPIPSFLQMTKSAVSCLKLCRLVAFLSEGLDTGSKSALPLCFRFTSKPLIPGFESSLRRTTTHHGLSFGSSSSQLSS